MIIAKMQTPLIPPRAILSATFILYWSMGKKNANDIMRCNIHIIAFNCSNKAWRKCTLADEKIHIHDVWGNERQRNALRSLSNFQ